ncbi:MAG: SCP2 sterol-binding domain-containing protein, partial [Actinomycetota bacterium]
MNAMWLLTAALVAEVLAVEPDVAPAEPLYDLLLPFRDLWSSVFGHVLCLGSVERTLGILATALERWEAAEDHFSRAERQHREAGVLPWLARTLHDRATMRRRRGDPSDAPRTEADLIEAISICESIGYTRIARRCRQMLNPSASSTEKAPARARFTEQATTAIGSRARNALSRFVRDASDSDLERRFGSSIALAGMMKAMARSFRPSRAFGFEGAIAFEILRTGAQVGEGEWWTITVSGTKAGAGRGKLGEPVASIHVSAADLVRLISGELNPVAALVQRRTIVDGDIVFASRLDDMFGGVADDTALTGEPKHTADS